MEKFIVIISLLFILPTLAQTNEIYGITRNNNPGVTYLAKVNTTNGSIEDISTTSNSEYIANFSFTVDPYLGIYYYANLDSFIGLDMNTGELVHENVITTSQAPIFQNFIYNEISQEIIGLERGGGSDIYLSKINPDTGIVTPISSNPLDNTNTITFSGSAIDILNQWYHFFSDGKLLSVDIASGSVIHDPIVDTTDFAYFNNLIYNPVDGNLYAIGRNSSPNELFFVQINPVTGAVNTLSPNSLGEALAFEGSALDPYSGIYYFKRPDPMSIVGVDVATGIEVSAVPFDFSDSNGAYFGYFYFGGQTAQLLHSNNSFSKESNINIYPNPSGNILRVNGKSMSRISLYSITGQQLANWNNNNEQTINLDVSAYKSGAYFLKVFNKQEEAITLKFIKK